VREFELGVSDPLLHVLYAGYLEANLVSSNFELEGAGRIEDGKPIAFQNRILDFVPHLPVGVEEEL